MRRRPPHRPRTERANLAAPDDSDGGPADRERRSDHGQTRGDAGAGGGPSVTRRSSLRAVGGLLVAGGVHGVPSSDGLVDEATEAVQADDDARDDFIWLGAAQWGDEALRENQLAFAERNDLAMLYGQPRTNMPGVGDLVRPALEDARERGLDAWVNLGVFRDMTPEQFLEDEDKRERHLAGLREVAEQLDAFDDGRVVLWQEAPVMGRWAESGDWNDETVRNLREYGPAVFDAQMTAIKDVSESVEVGIFVHFPYIVDSKRPEVFAELADNLRERDAVPDFGFADFYRGWYEKDVGPGPADAAVRSLISNTREHLDREAYYLAQAHTINPGHTPSGQSIRANLRASLDAEAAGVGWYMSGDYDATTTGFDPLVPNPEDPGLGDGPVATPTVSRDRYQYAWNVTLPTRGVDPGDRFTCWLHGDGFGFHDHRVEARTADGEWAFLGDVGGYLDGDYPYANGRTAALRALGRDRFTGDGTLELRIATAADADSTALSAVLATPWDPDAFLTEREMTALLTGDRDLAPFELGRTAPDGDLVPGERSRVTVPVDDRILSLTRLAHPEYADAVERLAAAEDEAGYDPDGRFDLWLAGAGLADPTAVPSLLDGDGESVAPTDACAVAVSSDEAALYYGLERERFLGDGLSFGTRGALTTRVDRAVAMPAAGSACFRSPERAAALLDEQPGEVATYALDWLDGAP